MVIAEGVTSENIYIQSATLNGEPYERSWITHDDIVEGGILIFKMGPDPNKNRGSSFDAIPPSMSSE
jgi:putative alpha-1,2-mannosidase